MQVKTRAESGGDITITRCVAERNRFDGIDAPIERLACQTVRNRHSFEADADVRFRHISAKRRFGTGDHIVAILTDVHIVRIRRRSSRPAQHSSYVLNRTAVDRIGLGVEEGERGGVVREGGVGAGRQRHKKQRSGEEP